MLFFVDGDSIMAFARLRDSYKNLQTNTVYIEMIIWLILVVVVELHLAYCILDKNKMQMDAKHLSSLRR